MNKKLEYDISYYWSKIKSNSFDQETIKGLIISLRDFVSRRGLIKEIGHFIAHPNRNQGMIWKNVSNTGYNKSTNTINFVMPVEGTDFIADIKDKLYFYNFIENQEVDNVLDSYNNDILACILGILHFTSLKIGQEIYTLKIEPNKSKNSSDQHTLCMFAVKAGDCGSCVITTDLESSLYIDDIVTFNNDLNIRAVRDIVQTIKLKPY